MNKSSIQCTKCNEEKVYIAMKDSKSNTTNRSKRERYISTAACDALRIIGSIRMGFISIGIYFVIPIIIVLECLLIRFDPPRPRWKI